MTKRVVVTGWGIHSCLGDDVDAMYSAFMKGETAFTALKNPIFSDDSYLVVGKTEKPKSTKLHDRKVQKVTTKKDLMGLAAAFDCLKMANIQKGDVDPERIGIYTGAASTHVDDLNAYFELLKSCEKNSEISTAEFGQGLLGNVNPMVMMQTLMNNVLCYVSIPLDIRGVNANFIDYQISGLRAVGEGYLAIKEGRADQIVAGGISGEPDLYHSREGIELGYLHPHLSSESESTDVVRPYDKSRTGTILSEAAAFCVIESLESAQNRGAKILGEIKGFKMNSEANFNFMKKNKGESMEVCIKEILESSSCSADSVSAVYGHGNGAVNGDEIDLQVLDRVFSKRKKKVPLTSVKGCIGETSEASGVFSMIAALISSENQKIPGIHNFELSAENTSKVTIGSKGQDIEKGPILVTTTSFSGANANILVEKFTA